MTDMTAEQAILAELRRALGHDGEVYQNVAKMLRQALTAPRVPDVVGWIDAEIIKINNAKWGAIENHDDHGLRMLNTFTEKLEYLKTLLAAPAPADELNAALTRYVRDEVRWPGDNTPTKSQADREAELATLRERVKVLEDAFDTLMEEYEDRKAQFGSEYLWNKHEDRIAIQQASRLRNGGV